MAPDVTEAADRAVVRISDLMEKERIGRSDRPFALLAGGAVDGLAIERQLTLSIGQIEL
jgi:hypothetical protein